MSADAEAAEFAATMGLAFLAADFCLEPETLPVFIAWVHTRDATPTTWTRERLQPLVDNLRLMMQRSRAAL